MSGVDRRTFLRTVAAAAFAPALGPAWWQAAYAAPAVPGTGPYGPLGGPDANGLLLPAGFTSRVVARSGAPVPGTGMVWPSHPDGAAVFPAPDGGWLYAANSEVLDGGGGASVIRFRPDGSVADAYPILRGTSGNCSGGPTPWGTWLSCEEPYAAESTADGWVWECDPTKAGQGVVRTAMGRCNHEAATVDPVGKRVYLSEDRPDGRFYRFTPRRYPDLAAGSLEAAVVAPTGQVTWVPVPDPSATSAPLRAQVPQATAFNRGEGCWHDSGFVYLTTTGDNRVWVHDLAAETIGVLYDARDHPNPPLTGVDTLLVSSAHDVYVAEDGGTMEVVMISRERVVAPVLRCLGNDTSEITGLAFDPSGQRLYFSSQRGPAPGGAGVTFEISGPFRRAGAPAPATTPVVAVTAPKAPLPTFPPSTVALAQLQAVPDTPVRLDPALCRPLCEAARAPAPRSNGALTIVAAGLVGSVWAALWRFRRARLDGVDVDSVDSKDGMDRTVRRREPALPVNPPR